MNIVQLHDNLFELLCLIDDICRKENVRYFLDGGTAIGAVREKDFIPWDDDMDIKVLAEDYPAFKAAMEKNLPRHYHLVEPEVFAPGFYDFVVRIYDDRILLRKETEEDRYYRNFQNHFGTDVFIYFNAPAQPWRQKLLRLETKVLYGLGMAHRYRVKDQKYTTLQKLQVAVLCLLGKPFPAAWTCRRWKKAMLRWQGKNTGWVYTGNYPVNQLFFFPAENYMGTCEGEIRGRKFPLGNGVDAELRAIYGDYMQPPVDKDAFIHHLDPEDMI